MQVIRIVVPQQLMLSNTLIPRKCKIFRFTHTIKRRKYFSNFFFSDTIFILGPSHHYRLGGCALTRTTEYETPLYNLIIDQESEWRDCNRINILNI